MHNWGEGGAPYRWGAWRAHEEEHEEEKEQLWHICEEEQKNVTIYVEETAHN